MLNRTKTKTIVSSQFPDFYSIEGEDFIAFVETYYDWLEINGYGTGSIDFPSIKDIDLTQDKFLNHFKNTYMAGLPDDILGNQRLLQKHILDLYRSKGSYEGLKLLFRLLYNEDVNVYIPSYDILKTSDGEWVKKYYIELNANDNIKKFENTIIYGKTSGAYALVESYERRIVNNIEIDILFLSNINGNFLVNESIYSEEFGESNILNYQIEGSASDFNVFYSTPNFKIGDILVDQNNRNLKYNVIKLKNSVGGVISPIIIDGGSGYSLDNTTYTVTQANTNPGVGFSFRVSEISDTEIISISNTFISTYANTALNANNFLMPGPGPENINSIISTSLVYSDIEIGTISAIELLNPGQYYNDSIQISVKDNLISRLELSDTDGSIKGTNANIDTPVVVGVNLVDRVKVVNSGLAYSDNKNITLVKDNNQNMKVIGNIKLGPIGQEEGYFKNTKGFLSSDKYLQDSYYYQEFSYDIISTKTLSNYISILKKIIHPVGNEVFGSINNDLNSNMEFNTENVVNIISENPDLLTNRGGSIILTDITGNISLKKGSNISFPYVAFGAGII